MKCPECDSRVLKVYNSRIHESQNCKSRWRICGECQHRFTTVELLGKVRLKDDEAFKIDLDAIYELSGSGAEPEVLG
jgi:transcriptional regulator NrdR family protein